MAALIERETIINFNAAEKTFNIWSCDPSWEKKIQKLPGAHAHQNGWEADVPKTWLKIAKPKGMTEAQKTARAKNLKKAISRKKKG